MMTELTRRNLRAEAWVDWLGLAYRGLYYLLVSAPVWGTVLALAIVWNRAGL
jgi:hypothetical protein